MDSRLWKRVVLVLALLLCAGTALAGPPYVADDPTPTAPGGYEIYAFTTGAVARDGSEGSLGVDFNYGGARDLQLTAVLPLAWGNPDAGSGSFGLGNVELAAKYRFVHQADVGLDAAFFPRVLVPSPSSATGVEHAALLLPLWLGHSWGRWSTFGGGGYEVNTGGDSRSFWTVAWAVTDQVTDSLQVGAEVFHQSTASRDARSDTGIDIGGIQDLSEHLHLLASVGPGLQHSGENGRIHWYAALLFTF